MESLHLPWPVIVTKWFICIYAEVLPVEVPSFYLVLPSFTDFFSGSTLFDRFTGFRGLWT